MTQDAFKNMPGLSGGKMTNSHTLFDRRGDPWVTDKEGKRGFHRQTTALKPISDTEAEKRRQISKMNEELGRPRPGPPRETVTIPEDPDRDMYFLAGRANPKNPDRVLPASKKKPVPVADKRRKAVAILRAMHNEIHPTKTIKIT